MIASRPSSALATLLAIVVLYFQLLISPAIGSQGEDAKYSQDIKIILSAREQMVRSVAFLDEHPEIFSSVSTNGDILRLNGEQRMLARQSWQNFLDHLLLLDSIGHRYEMLYREAHSNSEKNRFFTPAFACFLAQYHYALQFLERMEHNPNMHVILNEEIPELGLEESTYAKIKFRYLNVLRGAEFARLYVVYRSLFDGLNSPLQSAIEEDAKAIWAMGKGTGPVLTLQNAVTIIGDFGFTAWFPIQKGVSELMGKTKIWRLGISLISPAQIESLKTHLKPGDIMLQRREWYATNVGIPGFWTHAALYIGTPKERREYFTSQEAREWVKHQGSEDGMIESLLQQKYPQKYLQSIQPREHGTMPRVLEAIGEGVSFTTLEHSAAADSIVVLRPNLSQKSIASALTEAFRYSGRPYDFNFDFRTDSEVVCSELIYKAYEGTENTPGLSLPLTEVLNRPLLSPNEIAHLFDKEYGTRNQQLLFVAFLDGDEKSQAASEASVETFRKSWMRPKWHILVKDAKH